MDVDHPDSLDMAAAIRSLPAQIEATLHDLRHGIAGLPGRDEIDELAVLGVGASAWVGDVLGAVAAEVSPYPITVTRDYELPGFVDDRTLAVVVSWSGQTEEIVQAATEAAHAGARLLVVSAGGALSEQAGYWGAPLVVPVASGPSRAAVGAAIAIGLLALEQVGAFPGARSYLAETATHLQERLPALTVAAGDLARRLGHSLPLIYGGGPIGAVAATRWKSSLNENAKVPAFASRIPDLCHDEIAGWGQHGDVTRQVFSLIELRHDFEHPQIARRFELVNELVDEVVQQRLAVEARGDSPVAQLFDLVLLGDLFSLEVARVTGVDPGPVAAVQHIIDGIR